MIGLINGLMTAVLIVVFIGIWVWAWRGRNKDSFNRMAHLPLEDSVDQAEVSDVE